MKLAPYLWMLIGSLMFTIMGGFAHELGSRCDWQTIAFFRSFLVLAFVGGLAIRSGVKLVFLRPARLWLRSIAGSISLVGSFYALTRLPVSNVLTLTNTFPIWVALLSWPLLGEAPSMRVYFAIACAVCGVFLIQNPESSQWDFAFLVALLTAVATAVAMLGLHRLKDIAPLAVVVHFSLVAAGISIASCFVFPWSPTAQGLADGSTWLLLLGVGITAAIGQIFLTKAFAAGPPAKVSVVSLSQVVFALAIDLVFWNHRLEWWMILGMALIVLPTAWVMLESAADTGPNRDGE